MNADALPQEYDAFDQLATMVAIARSDGHCLLANSTLENAVAVSRRALLRGNVLDWFVDPLPMRETLLALQRNEVTSGRFEAQLKRAPLGSFEPLLVRVSASQMDTQDWVLLEIVEIEQQTRQDREERALGLAQANKELLRNLAHEIKNPLGGIRGAAQLLEMELNTRPNALARLRGGMSGPKPKRAAAARGLTEYTQVIIHEADRLQALVDRLLAPHRKPHVVGDVNIHEVCERVRLLISSEFPRGLEVQRDYDTSIPEFRGDREQLIQAVLNIVRNATEALSRADRRRQRAAGAAHAHRTAGDHRQAALPTGIGIACSGQRAGCARGHSRSHLPSAGVGAGRRLGARVDAGADLRATTPWHDRVRQRARTDQFQDPHSLALTP